MIRWFWYDIFATTNELCKDDLWTGHLVAERAREKLANLIRARCAPHHELRGYNKLRRQVSPQELEPVMKTFYRFEKKEMANAANAMIQIYEKESPFLCSKYGTSYLQDLQTKVKKHFQKELQSSILS